MRTNPYDALRKIHAITVGTRPKSATGAIDRVCSEALASEHQPGLYTTQKDALEAIRSAMSRPCFHSSELLTIAEQGLSLPAVELTPAQQHADKLAGFLFNYADMLDTVIDGDQVNLSFAQAKRAEISELCDLLRPPAPPTLDEALDVVRALLSSDLCSSEVESAHQLLARVPK